jgi:hypothetical protein
MSEEFRYATQLLAYADLLKVWVMVDSRSIIPFVTSQFRNLSISATAWTKSEFATVG